MSHPTQASTSAAQVPVKYDDAKRALDVFTGGLGNFSREIIASVKELHAVADKATSTFLMAFGSALLVLTLFMRLKPFGVRLAEITPAEIIMLTLCSSVFILGGAAIRLYQNVTERQFQRLLTEHGTRIISEQQRHYLESLETIRNEAEQKLEPKQQPKW